jgi:prephenate dehydratase
MTHNAENIIAFMGVMGANADTACRQNEPYMETLPCASFEDVFEAVQQDKAKLGMVPIENTQAGRVAEIHQLLPKSGLHIVGEYFLPVRHVLAGVKGGKLEDVKNVYSHPQALMQCRRNIRQLQLTPHVHSNTAVAARDVAEWKDSGKAAICSTLAAELYGLDVLKTDMQDADDNVTVFVKIAREPLDYDSFSPKEMVLTSVLFTLRNIPAALYKALGGFATNGVNILKLESYIPGGNSQLAQFFITFVGSPSEASVQLALEELGFFTKKVDVLGVYSAAPQRQQDGNI